MGVCLSVCLAGVMTASVAVTSASEAAVSSDVVMQSVQELAAESQVSDDSFVQRSHHQPSTSPDTVDITASEDRSSEVQKDSEMTYSAIDKDAENVEKEVVTELAVDKDTDDHQSKPKTDFNVDIESEDNQTKPAAESDLDKTLEDGVEESRSVEDETQALTSTEPVSVHETVVDGEVVADDSEPSEEQFLSPAASEADIVGTMSPTEEPAASEEPASSEAEDAGSTTWTAKVPLLDTEPPAMDSDYEEAALCEMEEEQPLSSETVSRNSDGVEQDGCDTSRQNDDRQTSATTDQPSPATTNTVKPKPM